MVHMVLKTAFPLMHLLMVQLVAGTIVCAEAPEEPYMGLEISSDQSPSQFARNHITSKNITDCNKVMVKVNNRRSCKPINTFIRSNIKEVNKVCKKGTFLNCKQQPDYKRCFMSSVKFNLTICKKKNSGRSCKYDSPHKMDAYIAIGCNRKHQAVHFEKYVNESQVCMHGTE